MSSTLDLLDQATFDMGRVTRSVSVLQCVWIYNRPIDVDGLRRFHHHLEHGRLARRIERSPLPFGRHRWVATEGPSEIEFVPTTRPRTDLEDWLEAQAHSPLDCVHGPGLHLAVLPFAEGGCAVSLVVDHCLTDGIGLAQALTEAALGHDDPIRWPSPTSRTRWQALREDLRQAVRDVPAVGRAFAGVMKVGRSGTATAAMASPEARPPDPQSDDVADPHDDQEEIRFPIATVFVAADQWKARARALGGNSNALAVAVAARLAQRGGRVADDGSVVVMVPVNKRRENDTRANAINNVGVTITNPAQSTNDLREVKAAIWHALVEHREAGDRDQAVNALVPLLPRRVLAGFQGRAVLPRHVVGSSNLGVFDAAATRPDGSEAERFAIRNNFLHVSRGTMRKRNGMQAMMSGTACGQVFISAVSLGPDCTASIDELNQNLWNTLNDFELGGVHAMADTLG
jgi:diacylglycerol O-acyltransferase